MAEDSAAPTSIERAAAADDAPSAAVKKQSAGFLSRLRRMLSGISNEDFEKKLRHLSREEASVVARMKRRAGSSRKTARNIIALSILLEVVAVTYAIMTTRSMDLNWQMRAARVLPMFILPGLASVIYTGLVGFTRMLDRKDQKTLERLRAERKEKIDELKERTNYYTTQQLIQRYELDPAAKAAAAIVLASKLGADSGLKVYVGDDSNTNTSSGRSNDVEVVQSSGLRKRKKSYSRSLSTGSVSVDQFIDENSNELGGGQEGTAAQNQMTFEHYKGTNPANGGWVARIAALLVGEDPTQCYALICGNCHMHNGLARKEDFPYITYYCPHCHALNVSRPAEEHEYDPSSGKLTPCTPGYGSGSEDAGRSYVTGTAVTGSLETVRELSPEISEEKEADLQAG